MHLIFANVVGFSFVIFPIFDAVVQSVRTIWLCPEGCLGSLAARRDTISPVADFGFEAVV